MKKQRVTYCMFETVVSVFAIYFILGWNNPVPEEFLSLNMHPFVLVVAAMALRYGGYASLLSACLASAVFYYAYAASGKDLLLFFIEFDYYKFPLMFFVTSVVLGRFKDNYEFEMNVRQKKISALDDAGQKLEDELKKALFIKDELKKQIVGAEYSIVSLYEIAASLDTLYPEGVYTETMGILQKFIKAKSVSIYTIDGKSRTLRLKVHLGGKKKSGQFFDLEKDFCWKRVMEEKKAIRATGECRTGFPVMAAPLIEDGMVKAIICIDDMDFEHVSDYAFHLFKVIVEWVNRSLLKALFIHSQLNPSQCIKGTGVLKMGNFARRYQEEEKRSLRFDMEFGILAYRVPVEGIEETGAKMTEVIRAVDVMGYERETETLYVLLPATPLEHIDAVKERIEASFGYELKPVSTNLGNFEKWKGRNEN